MAFGQYGLAKVGLKSERGFDCLPRLFTQGERWLKIPCEISDRIRI